MATKQDTINRLTSQRKQILTDARKLLDKADAEHRDINADEQRHWDAAMTDVEDIDARIGELTRVAAGEARAEELAREFPTIARPVLNGGADFEPSNVRAFLRGVTDHLDADLSGVHRQIDRSGRWSVTEGRSLTVGTATAGGNTVPSSFYGQLVEHLTAASGIRQTNATILTTPTGDSLSVPKTTAHSSAAIIAEGASITASDPTFGAVTLGGYKYGFSVQVSTELLNDTGVDLAGYLAREAGTALGNACGADFVTGNGTSKPSGVVAGATTGTTGEAGKAGAFTADDLVDLYYSVLPQYRTNGFWMMNDATAAAARKLKDSDGRWLWDQSLTAGEPSQLLGRPVVLDPNVADIAAGAKSVIFGDFSRYFIRDVKGIRFERSDDFAFQNDLVTFRALLRTDGALVDTTGAVKVFVGGAAS